MRGNSAHRAAVRLKSVDLLEQFGFLAGELVTLLGLGKRAARKQARGRGGSRASPRRRNGAVPLAHGEWRFDPLIQY